jgi:hypothetical protein
MHEDTKIVAFSRADPSKKDWIYQQFTSRIKQAIIVVLTIFGFIYKCYRSYSNRDSCGDSLL